MANIITIYECPYCGNTFYTMPEAEKHEIKCHARPERIAIDLSELTQLNCRSVFAAKQGSFQNSRQYHFTEEYSSQEVYCRGCQPVTSKTNGKLW